MALVVFLRGVNVGGHKTFKPAAFAKSFSTVEVENLGAAGTFVVRGNASETSVRAEFGRKLPFKTPLMICTAAEIARLVSSRPFGAQAPAKDEKRYVTIFEKPQRKPPRLPLDFPPTNDWCVRLLRVAGKFALSVWRKRGKRLVYPNEVFEKTFGAPATTRGWPTILSVVETLQE
ncbi:MAG TPA: DUF1697 domain-containing protein [Candidatus Nitrosotenuis sp.]|nr:DUF1697 domain-containing protein [Candidatus Nitrosotenuis sp.]